MRHLIGIGKTKELAGRRRLAMDDLQVLEDLFYEGFQRQFAGYGACVVSGCEVSGQTGAWNIAPGLVYINNKLIYWPGAQNYDLKSNTYLVEDEPLYLAERLFDSVSEERPGVIQYTCKLTESSYTGEGILMTTGGPGRMYYNLLGDRIYQQQFQRMSRDIMPVGSIIMWAGTLDNFDTSGLGKESMTGWALCNGANGTPNMRSRFPVGYDPEVTEYKVVGNTGGVKEVTLGINNLPKHRHIATPGGGQYGTVRRTVAGENKTIGAGSVDTTGAGDQLDVTSTPGTDQEVGSDQPHENRPPFFVVAYIMKVSIGNISEGGTGGTGTNPGGGTGGTNNCNLVSMQVLGEYLFNNSQVVVMYHQGEFWVFNIWDSTSPRIAYVRGRNFLNWSQFVPATTLPNLSCFAPYDTAYDGREHPAAFNGAPAGWERITDAGGYVAFRELTTTNPGTGGGTNPGSGSGDINSTITFETEVA